MVTYLLEILYTFDIRNLRSALMDIQNSVDLPMFVTVPKIFLS